MKEVFQEKFERTGAIEAVEAKANTVEAKGEQITPQSSAESEPVVSKKMAELREQITAQEKLDSTLQQPSTEFSAEIRELIGSAEKPAERLANMLSHHNVHPFERQSFLVNEFVSKNAAQ